MQQTLNPTSEIVERAKSQLKLTSKRLLHLLSFVPDDKLQWASSSTSRTPIRIVAHSALTSRDFANIVTGNMAQPMPSPDEFFKRLHEGEHKYTTRESVTALINETTAELCKALDSVNDANINSKASSPFGPIAMQFWMDETHRHMAGHVGQLEYMQTIWGDLDNHLS